MSSMALQDIKEKKLWKHARTQNVKTLLLLYNSPQTQFVGGIINSIKHSSSILSKQNHLPALDTPLSQRNVLY